MDSSDEIERQDDSVEGETDQEWTIIDPKTEFESAVASLKSLDLGKSLLLAGGHMDSESDEKSPQQEVRTSEEHIQFLLKCVSDLEEQNRMQAMAHAEELDNMRKDYALLDRECDYWRVRCKESVESLTTNNQALLSYFNLLQERVAYLHSQVRAIRHEIDDTTPPAIPTPTPLEVNTMLPHLEANVYNLEQDMQSLFAEFHDLVNSNSANKCKISLCHFGSNDIAIFFPTPKGDYLAFNIGAPHHYLSAESKALIGKDAHFRKIYVLGRIIYKEEHVTTAEHSPYKLAPGTKYYEVHVTSVTSVLESRHSKKK